MECIPCCRHRLLNTNKCIDLLRRISSPESDADELYGRLVSYFTCNPLNSVESRRLRSLYQENQGKHGIEDFACTSLWFCHLQASSCHALDDGILKEKSISSLDSYVTVSQEGYDEIAPYA